MFIVKHKNRRSDKDRNPFFFRIGGDSKTDTAGAIVHDLESAAEILEGVHADLIKLSHAAMVAVRAAKRAAKPVRPTIWSMYPRTLRPRSGRPVPLAETPAASLLGRRSADRATPDRRVLLEHAQAQAGVLFLTDRVA